MELLGLKGEGPTDPVLLRDWQPLFVPGVEPARSACHRSRRCHRMVAAQQRSFARRARLQPFDYVEVVRGQYSPEYRERDARRGARPSSPL